MANNNLSRVVWKVSLPIIFLEATETFGHLIATLFLARVGVTELGAIAVADSVMLLFLLLPLALVDGIQILTARRVGQRQPEAVGAAFNQGLLLVLSCASPAWGRSSSSRLWWRIGWWNPTPWEMPSTAI